MEKITEEEYNQKVIKMCEKNHIWLNKMTYFISPTVEQKIALADMILEKLNTKSCLLPSNGITVDHEKVRELAELTPILYLSINWS